MNKFIERSKELRKLKNTTQKEIAEKIGITSNAYSNYEQGLREPSLDIIIEICKYFDCTSDYLLGLTDY